CRARTFRTSETFSPVADMKRPADALNAACGRMTTTSSGAVAVASAAGFLRLVCLLADLRATLISFLQERLLRTTAEATMPLLGMLLARLRVRRNDPFHTTQG